MKTYNNIPVDLFKWDVFKQEYAYKYLDFDRNKTVEEMTSGSDRIVKTERVIGKDGFYKLKVTYLENENYVSKDSEIYVAMLLYRNDFDKDRKVKKYVKSITNLIPEEKRLSEKRVNQILNCLHDNNIIKRHTSDNIKGANIYELSLNSDKYITVYDEILDNKNLSISEIIFYLRLLLISNKNETNARYLQYNVTQLAKSLHVSRQIFRKRIQKLVDEKIISIVNQVLMFDLQNRNSKELKAIAQRKIDIRVEQKAEPVNASHLIAEYVQQNEETKEEVVDKKIKQKTEVIINERHYTGTSGWDLSKAQL